jgi:hypothetical protein
MPLDMQAGKERKVDEILNGGAWDWSCALCEFDNKTFGECGSCGMPIIFSCKPPEVECNKADIEKENEEKVDIDEATELNTNDIVFKQVTSSLSDLLCKPFFNQQCLRPVAKVKHKIAVSAIASAAISEDLPPNRLVLLPVKRTIPLLAQSIPYRPRTRSIQIFSSTQASLLCSGGRRKNPYMFGVGDEDAGWNCEAECIKDKKKSE